MKEHQKTREELLQEIDALRERLVHYEPDASENAPEAGFGPTSMFRTLAEAAPVGILILQDKELAYANTALVNLTGLEPEDLKVQRFWDLVHPDHRELVQQRAAARQAGEPVPEAYEIKFVAASGETRWAQFRGTSIMYHGRPATLGFVQDVTEHKLADEELAASEEKYRTLVESAGEAIFTCDRNGVFLYMNRVAARQLGGLPQDFIGKTQWDVFPKWLAERQMGQVRRVFETGQGFAREVVVVVQGQERLYHTTGVPVRDARGEITSFLGVARDITELVEIKARLRDSEEKYKRFVDALPVGVFQSTPDGKVVSGNPALARQYGYDTVADYLAVPAEHTWAEPGERKEWLALLERDGTLNDYEVKLKRKDGSYIWVSVSAQGSFDDQDRLVRIDGVEVEVTPRRKAEEALRRTGESMRALLNAPNHVMFLMDTDGTALALNEALARDIGATPDEILGTKVHDWIPPELARSRREWEQKVIQTGQVQHFEDGDGHTIWENRLYPVFDDHGKVEAIAVSALDVTERKRAEDALRASEEKYRNLFENAQVGMFRTAMDGSRIYALNKKMADILGYEVDELLDQPAYTHWFNPEDRARLQERVEQEGSVQDHEATMRTRTGERRDVLVSVGSYPEDGYYEGSIVDITESKKARRALEESEAMFRAVADTAPVVITINQSDKIVYANKLAFQVARLEPSDLGHINFWDLVSPDCREQVKQIGLARQRGEKVPDSYELQWVSKDGEVRWGLMNGCLMEYKGAPATLGVVVDITERKLAEEQLRTSQANLSAIVENTSDFILLSDANAYPIYFNTAYARIMKELIGLDMKPGLKPHTMLPDAEGRAFWEDCHRRVLSGERFGAEYVFRAENQPPRYFEHSFNPIFEADRVRGFSEVSREITDRKQAEEALRESEEEFRRIAERSFDAIVNIDIEGRLTYASPAVAKLAGYKPDETVGRHISEFVSEKHLSGVGKALATTALGQPVEGVQFEITSADGQSIYVEANATPIIRDGRVIGTQAVIRDITARRQAEQMLEQAYEEQSKQLRQVAGGIAHDIYNDLYPVTASLHKLRQRLEKSPGPDQERNLRLLQLMEDAVNRAIDLTESVNLYSRLQRDETGESSRLAVVVAAVLESNWDRLSGLGVTLDVDIPDSLEIVCPESQVFSLLNNLMLNALDAMEQSGSRSVRIAARPGRSRVSIEFADTGEGIPPDVLARIFDPFFSTKPLTGTGLGLAIVKRIVDLNGGSVTVKSTVDLGTTFTIILSGDVGT